MNRHTVRFEPPLTDAEFEEFRSRHRDMRLELMKDGAILMKPNIMPPMLPLTPPCDRKPITRAMRDAAQEWLRSYRNEHGSKPEDKSAKAAVDKQVPAGQPMTIDRRFTSFRLIEKPKNLSRGEGTFIYMLIVKLGGEPGKANWLTFTGVVNAAEAADYGTLLHRDRGNVTVPDSAYYWLNKWSREGYMARE
jgi:hypothetical protein